MAINLDRFEQVIKGPEKSDPLKKSVDALTDAANKITQAVDAFNARKEPLPEEDPELDNIDTDPDKGIPGKD